MTKGVRLVEVEHRFPANGFDYYECYSIGSCNGLMCILLVSIVYLMFIWNPVTGELEEIVLPRQSGSGGVRLVENASWFGYLPSIDNYKIFLSYFVDDLILGHRMYVYSFSTSTWREICVTDELSRSFGRVYNTIFFSEALHSLRERTWICKFDLVEETFDKIPLTIDVPDILNQPPHSLGVIAKYDCLCVVFVHYHNALVYVDSDGEREEDEDPVSLEVWMLQEYDNFNSWKKWCKIDLKGVVFRYWMNFLGFIYDSCLCFQGEGGLIIIDPMSDPPSYVIACIGSYERVLVMRNYVESLISPVDLH